MTGKFAITLFLSTFFIFCPAAMVTAETPDLPVVQLLGGRYYVYTAAKGESLFGIARKFGWDDKVLSELNKTAVSPLKKGMKIYYPAENVEINEADKSSSNEKVSEINHKIKRGETVYAIASMYGVPVERIYSLNPGSRNGIRAGETLLIRKGEKLLEGKKGNEESSVFYTVKSGDTLYKLSQDYEVSIAAIMQSNPGVDESNFRAGSTIKIPQRGSGLSTTIQTVEEETLQELEIHQVSKDDTWSSIASQSGVDEETLKEANPDLSKLKNKDYIAVPKIRRHLAEKEVVTEDPRETTAGGINEIYEDIHNLVNSENEQEVTVKVAVVSENPESKKDAEFLRGFLAGIDRQKRENYKIDLKVIAGSESGADITSSLEEFKPTIVFSTWETQLPDFLCDYAYESHTPVVNTFDVKSDAYTDNPYIVQLLTPPSLFNDNVAHYVSNRYDGYKLLMIGDEDSNDQLAEALLAIWDPELVRNAPISAIIPEAFRDGGKYLIYGYDVKKQEVADLIERVTQVRTEKPLADIAFLGRPNLIMFEETMLDDFRKAELSIPSRFYPDKNSAEYREFLQRYKMLFNRVPGKSMPLYAAVGYDTSSYFLPELAKEKGDINRLSVSRNTVQSDYSLWRPSNWSGLLNPPVYLIDYTTLGGINKNVILYNE